MGGEGLHEDPVLDERADRMGGAGERGDLRAALRSGRDVRQHPAAAAAQGVRGERPGRQEAAEGGDDLPQERPGRKIPAPETWEDFFGDEMLGLGMDTDFEDLDFEFLTSVSNVTVSPFEDMFMDPADSELYGYEIPDFDSLRSGEPASAR